MFGSEAMKGKASEKKKREARGGRSYEMKWGKKRQPKFDETRRGKRGEGGSKQRPAAAMAGGDSLHHLTRSREKSEPT